MIISCPSAPLRFTQTRLLLPLTCALASLIEGLYFFLLMRYVNYKLFFCLSVRNLHQKILLRASVFLWFTQPHPSFFSVPLCLCGSPSHTPSFFSVSLWFTQPHPSFFSVPLCLCGYPHRATISFCCPVTDFFSSVTLTRYTPVARLCTGKEKTEAETDFSSTTFPITSETESEKFLPEAN